MDLSRWWPLDGADDVWRELEATYGDPGRRYHDLRHLREVFQRLDELGGAGVGFHRTPVLLAAWFHDGVYDGQPGAEARSATWAETALAASGVAPGEVAEVARLVRVTEHHRPIRDDLDGCALSDADLGILAAPPDRYADYASAVRAEYAIVPEPDFRRARAEILRELVTRQAIFATDHARAHWEEPARTNLRRELAQLRGD